MVWRARSVSSAIGKVHSSAPISLIASRGTRASIGVRSPVKEARGLPSSTPSPGAPPISTACAASSLRPIASTTTRAPPRSSRAPTQRRVASTGSTSPAWRTSAMPQARARASRRGDRSKAITAHPASWKSCAARLPTSPSPSTATVSPAPAELAVAGAHRVDGGARAVDGRHLLHQPGVERALRPGADDRVLGADQRLPRPQGGRVDLDGLQLGPLPRREDDAPPAHVSAPSVLAYRIRTRAGHVAGECERAVAIVSPGRLHAGSMSVPGPRGPGTGWWALPAEVRPRQTIS